MKSVSPLNVSVGEKMTVEGFYFTPGYAENMVVLVAKDGRVSYVRSEHSTKTTITLTVPTKVQRLLKKDANGDRVPTKFRVKVIAKRPSRLGRRALAQPTISPNVGGDCDKDGSPNSDDADDDNDLLPDGLEKAVRTNPCVADSDGDKLLDGWEYISALDLNKNALPFPGKRPYPNALYKDAELDYDGDGMYAWAEHAMWWLGGKKYPIDYSDGDQTTNPVPVPAQTPWLDIDGNDILSDDERDFDKDTLSNVMELRLYDFRPWDGYPGVIQPDFLDRDTDGDSLPDGPDDQDHDDFSNVTEWMNGTWAMNPCDPNPLSRTCPKYMMKGAWPVKPDGLCPSATQLDGGQVRWTEKFDVAGYDPTVQC
ncbi:MAG TPA: hypothetical protein VEX36_04990 [Thermoleophilaceae bacterium]|nr:hypothetical protein [Thermoleophilaceae bacterium]